MEKFEETFKDEAKELLAELEAQLLELELDPSNADAIAGIFRCMHTIKGSGAMFGFNTIADFTHKIENVFDRVRKGELRVNTVLINLTLLSKDQIQIMLETKDSLISEETKEALQRITRELEIYCSSSTEEGDYEAGEESSPVMGEANNKTAKTFWIRFKPSLEILRNGTNIVQLLRELGEMGESIVIAQTDAIPGLEGLQPEGCYIYWDIILTANKTLDDVRGVFIFVDQDCDVKIDIVDNGDSDEEYSDCQKIGEILVNHGDLTAEQLNQALSAQKRLGELLVGSGALDSGKLESALSQQQYVRELRQERQQGETVTSIRVPSGKLDALVDMVGELVTVQARLSQTAFGRNDAELNAIAEEVERLTEELRDNALNIRMLPIGSTFNKLRRLVRDLSAQLGREVDLMVDGAETELDKTVIEKLNDPLVHLIRNSIDHGIEPPEVRKKAGKPPAGKVTLSAVHSGAHVFIHIEDDGAGLNNEGIRAKAIEKGIIDPSLDLSEKELFSLILAPGFSTAQKVTNVSGRGVGMDVVRQSIEALRGSIEISSEESKGTRITLKLPLTLAIIEGLLISAQEELFVLPLSAVKECVELSRDDIKKNQGRDIANVRGEIVPYIRLRDNFRLEGTPPAIEQIVITEIDGKHVGFVVDHVVGEYQTVIKSLGRVYRDIEGISGATILGDGTVALILDVPKLIHSVEEEALLVIR